MDRYFIVFDDVWEVRTWEAIELALVENNLGSKVITTTRNFDVAKASGKVYKLKPLSYDGPIWIHGLELVWASWSSTSPKVAKQEG